MSEISLLIGFLLSQLVSYYFHIDQNQLVKRYIEDAQFLLDGAFVSAAFSTLLFRMALSSFCTLVILFAIKYYVWFPLLCVDPMG